MPKFIILTSQATKRKCLINLQTDSFEDSGNGVTVHRGAGMMSLKAVESFDELCQLVLAAAGTIGTIGEIKEEKDVVD